MLTLNFNSILDDITIYLFYLNREKKISYLEYLEEEESLNFFIKDTYFRITLYNDSLVNLEIIDDLSGDLLEERILNLKNFYSTINSYIRNNSYIRE